jgi:hypothetical protein
MKPAEAYASLRAQRSLLRDQEWWTPQDEADYGALMDRFWQHMSEEERATADNEKYPQPFSCSGCRHFVMGTDGATWRIGEDLYGFCLKPREGSPFIPVPMTPPDPNRPHDPWNHWGADYGGKATMAVLPTHFCSGYKVRT